PPISTLFPYTTLFRSPLALAQAGLRGDLAGDVLGHTDQAADPAEAVAAEGMFADLEPVPAAVAVTPTQLALEHLPVADHFLQVRSEEHTSELQSRENL